MKKKVIRAFIYCIGMVVLASGISLNTKTGLGVSPIISVAYCVSQFTGFNFGNMTFLLYAIFVAAQFCLRGKRSHWYDLLQLPLSLVFSRLLNVFGTVPYVSSEHSLAFNLAMLALAIILTGIGICMTVNMRLIPNPGDGIVQALAERTGWKQGFAKNVFDIGSVCVTVTLGLVLMRRVVGINIGTLCAMLGVGRVVALTNKLFKSRMCAAAGVAEDIPLTAKIESAE